jgi:hypothetical protein
MVNLWFPCGRIRRGCAGHGIIPMNSMGYSAKSDEQGGPDLMTDVAIKAV